LNQEIVERNEGGENPKVTIGDGQMVSMQIVQGIYNEITGKTEKIIKSYQIHHKATQQDLIQLNLKIHQTCEQYHVIEKNCNVTVYQVDDCNQRYSSFERFQIFDQTSLSPIENVRLQYNLLIVPPKTNRPQPYKIEIDIHSRAAIKQKAKKNHRMPKIFIDIVALRTAVLEIQYVDYTIAKTLNETVDSWFEGLEQSKDNHYLNFLQNHSHYFSLLTQYLSALLLCIYFFIKSEMWLTGQSSPVELFKIALVAFGTVFIVSGIAVRFGAEIGRAIDNIQPLSFLKLTRGDEKAISELEKDNSRNKRKLVLNIALTLALNLFSAWLTYNIGIGI